MEDIGIGSIQDPTINLEYPEEWHAETNRQFQTLRWISFLATPETSKALVETLFPLENRGEVLELHQKDQKTFFNATLPEGINYDVHVQWIPIKTSNNATDSVVASFISDHIKDADVIVTERFVGGMVMTEIDFSEIDAIRAENIRPWIDKERIIVILLANGMSPTLGTRATGSPYSSLKPKRKPT